MRLTMPRGRIPRRRTIFLAGCAMALLLFSLWWWESWVILGERIDSARDRIARVQWINDHEADLQQRVNAAMEDKDLNSTFISETDTAQATAQLQKLVEQAVKDSGGNIISAQPVPSQTEGSLNTVSVQYQITVPPGGLTRLLYSLEKNRPYIFVDGADISNQPSSVMPGQEGEPNTPQLAMQLNLRAFVRAAQHG